METEARYTLVGSAVLLIVLLLAASLVWVMGGADRISYQHYTIYFHNQSMDGLDINSAVKLRGIKVGVVTDYAFVAGNKEAVRVNIKLDESTPIHINSQAYIKRNIVTGLATVEISNPDATSPLLTTISPNEQYPVIAEGSSDLDKVTTDLSQMAENGAVLLNKMNTMLSDDNRAAVTATLHNVQVLSAQLIAHKEMLDHAIQSFEDASDAVKLSANNFNQTTSHLDSNIQTLSDNANNTLTQATAALGDLQQQSVVISRQLQMLTNTANYQLNQISRDVHQSANTITTTGQRLANPRNLIFGSGKSEPAPGEQP
jgi:phospholipid/cholesterol/gamma-HCH transport system substrate-binding protein